MPKISCRGKTAKGEACRAAAGASGLCFLHGNPARAKELGQIGGRKNRHFTGVDLEVSPDMSANGLSDLAAQTIGLVLRGELRAREATAVAHLLNVQTRIIPLLEFEKRIAALEQRGLQFQEATSEQGRDATFEAERVVSVATKPLTEQAEVQVQGKSKLSGPREVVDAVEKEDERDSGMNTEQVTTPEAQAEAAPGQSDGIDVSGEEEGCH
jgi:hypothetical protein